MSDSINVSEVAVAEVASATFSIFPTVDADVGRDVVVVVAVVAAESFFSELDSADFFIPADVSSTDLLASMATFTAGDTGGFSR